MPWAQVQRLVRVTTWILGPHRYPLVLARPDDGGPELLVDWYPPDGWPPPFDDVTTGPPPYLQEYPYDMRTTGLVRPDEVLDAVEVVEELDLRVWSTPPPPPLPRPSGANADLDGRTYPAVSAHKPRLRLFAPGRAPCPPGSRRTGGVCGAGWSRAPR